MTRDADPKPVEARSVEATSSYEIVTQYRASLDPPGETGRQARIFVLWFVCLFAAVVVSASLGAHIPLSEAGTLKAEAELRRARIAKLKVALVLGLAVPGLLTWIVSSRYRRDGPHARGIFVDITSTGELRLWGRGYGTRVMLRGAELSERLVDVYAGRLGVWRQRRLLVRGPASAGGRVIELAAVALKTDMEKGLRVDGGEGDCVELGREDFDVLRAEIIARIEPSST